MKTITIKNPWASYIVHGFKDVENRSWKTNFRGRVLIHVGAKPYTKINNKKLILPERAIIGSVEIVDCVKDYVSPWAVEGFYHWVLRNPIVFENPVLNIRGSLGFWNVPKTICISIS